ncbi:MAG: hypothetical protein H6624_08920 [Bdellovibrionaceae bacterium]|nr:hypothetical protein [Bdellovibrionales bacterium]MCB9084455.1 hypothetical protein [Pseudobdellovibrionaceae bacterium]
MKARAIIRDVFGILLMSTVLILTSGCLDQNKDDEEGSSGLVVLSGSFASGGGQQKLLQSVSSQNFSLYKVYCLTFSNPPFAADSLIGSDGSFALALPVNQAFGCFVNNVSDNTPVATLVIEGDSSGFGGNSSGTLALGASVHLSGLNLDLTNGVVEVPRAAIAPHLAAPTVVFDPQSLHGGTYQMSCVTTGNTLMDSNCQQFISNDGDQVYFRIMTAAKNGGTVYGLGVWASGTAFANCGSIDMLTSEQASIEVEDGITFLQVAAGSAFNSDLNACPSRDGGSISSMDDVENYYAAGPLSQEGNAYTLRVDDSREVAPNCWRHDRTMVTFTAVGNDLVGRFNMSEYFDEQAPNACGSNQNGQGDFLVNFTRVN